MTTILNFNSVLKNRMALLFPSFLVAFAGALSITASAQQISNSEDFSLFEALESAGNTASAAEVARNSRNPGARNTQAAPTFSLVGISRIGSTHTVLLKHMNGDTIKVPLSGEINTVPDHELYRVLNHDARQVTLRFPAAVPCGDFPDQGVSCDSTANIATLSLTTADAVSVAVSDSQALESEDDGENTDSAEAAANAARRNPFAALRETNQQNGNAAPVNSGRFQPRRIDPADVPPGYRVVSTPFGDRLVEQ